MRAETLIQMNKKVNAFKIDDLVTVVSSCDEARAAVTAAQLQGQTLLLVTEPDACASLGPGYLLEMVRQAGLDGATAKALIDCGSDAGYAMLALRLGWKDVHLSGTPETVDRVAQMTEAAGGRFHVDLPSNLEKPAGLAVDQSR
jgi:hypothetical protein